MVFNYHNKFEAKWEHIVSREKLNGDKKPNRRFCKKKASIKDFKL